MFTFICWGSKYVCMYVFYVLYVVSIDMLVITVVYTHLLITQNVLNPFLRMIIFIILSLCSVPGWAESNTHAHTQQLLQKHGKKHKFMVFLQLITTKYVYTTHDTSTIVDCKQHHITLSEYWYSRWHLQITTLFHFLWIGVIKELHCFLVTLINTSH